MTGKSLVVKRQAKEEDKMRNMPCKSSNELLQTLLSRWSVKKHELRCELMSLKTILPPDHSGVKRANFKLNERLALKSNRKSYQQKSIH